MRPQIKPGLPRVRRGPGAVQIGLTPDRGIVLTGLQPGEEELLAQLDGTRQLSDLVAWARARGLPGERVRRLVGLLQDAGLLTGPAIDRAHIARWLQAGLDPLLPEALAWSVAYPEPCDPRQLLLDRSRHVVSVLGAGPLAAQTRAALRRTGLGVGAGLGVGGSEGVGFGAGKAPAARSLVVLVGSARDPAGDLARRDLVAAGQPHLAADAGPDRVSVGPLVDPGRSACLRCVELHRTDRDPGWPAVSAQLLSARARAGAGSDGGPESLTRLAATLLAVQAACWVDGRYAPASLGATLTLTLPDGLATRRAWPVHPRCGCQWLAASLPVEDGAPAAPPSPGWAPSRERRETMPR